MKTLRVILQDQLSLNISSLENCNKEEDLVVMMELNEDFIHVKHHKKKIAFIVAAMRHFALELKNKGYRLEYLKIDDCQNSGNLKEEILKLVSKYSIKKVIFTFPGEYRILQNILNLKDSDIELEILEDNRFLCAIYEFKKWAGDKKNLRMEFFYREMRKKYSVLMEKGAPTEGKWNYDAENRKFPNAKARIPQSFFAEPDEIAKEVLAIVGS